MKGGVCVECGEKGKYTCSKCRIVKYCSVPCSKQHQLSCSALKDLMDVDDDSSSNAEGEKVPAAEPTPAVPNRTPNLNRPRQVGPLSLKQLERLRFDPELRAMLQSPSLRETLGKVDEAFDARYLTETALLNDPEFKMSGCGLESFAEKALEVAKGPELGLREDVSDDPLAMFSALVHGAMDDEDD